MASDAGSLPLFPVATHKFIVLSIFTLGLYELYWCYQNWKRLKSVSGQSLSPFWRALFAPFWVFSLFKRIHDEATSAGISVGWSSDALALAYFILDMTWRLPDPLWLLGFAAFVPMIPVQEAAQCVNGRCAAQSAEPRNDSYSVGNVATIMIGGLILVLVLIGIVMRGLGRS